MTETIYLVIGPDEDGETVSWYTREELEEFLGELLEYRQPPEFLEAWCSGGVQCWKENQYLIVEGRIVVPRAVDVVKKYEV